MSSGETTQKELKGIGGWLIGIAIGLPLMIIMTLFGDYYVFNCVVRRLFMCHCGSKFKRWNEISVKCKCNLN